MTTRNITFSFNWAAIAHRPSALVRAPVTLITAWLLAAALLLALVLVVVTSVRQAERDRGAAMTVVKQRLACESLQPASTRLACVRAVEPSER